MQGYCPTLGNGENDARLVAYVGCRQGVWAGYGRIVFEAMDRRSVRRTGAHSTWERTCVCAGFRSRTARLRSLQDRGGFARFRANHAALSTITFLFAVIWESIAAFFTLRLPIRVFYTAFSDMLWWGDFVGGSIKAVVFGLAISLVSTAVGLQASGGARGVGRAAATSVVMSCFVIFALDFLITPPLARLLSS